MSRWPILRTPERAAPGIWALFGATIITIIAPVLLGAGIFLFAGFVFGHETEAGFGSFLFMIGFFLAFSFYLSWAGLIIAVPLAILAFRYGTAGWSVALVAGIAVGTLMFAVFGLAWFVTIPAGIIFALTFWLALRWLAPTSFGVSK